MIRQDSTLNLLARQSQLSLRQLHLLQKLTKLKTTYQITPATAIANYSNGTLLRLLTLKQIFKVFYWTLSGQLRQRLKRREIAQVISNSSLFDTGYYWQQNPYLEGTEIDPLGHYLDIGAMQGYDPHPLFDTSYYLETYPDVATLGINPLAHYLLEGAYLGYNPHPLFNTAYYWQQNPTLINNPINPLNHYLIQGVYEGKNPHPCFDTHYYLKENPDVANVGINPLIHFVLQGSRENRSPHPLINLCYLREEYPELQDNSINPLIYFLNQGILEIAPKSSEGLKIRGETPEIAVVVHLYYTDLWLEIFHFLKNIEEPYDLYISLPEDKPQSVSYLLKQFYPNAKVKKYQNRGRDIAPFLDLIITENLQRYKYICKIHSKKSLHRCDGNFWRTSLYQDLLGSPEKVQAIKQVLEEHPDIGIVGPSNNLIDCDSEHFWGSNLIWMQKLSRQMGVQENLEEHPFYAGSMFWFKPQAIKPLIDLRIKPEDFEIEKGQVDGTLAHAIERSFLMAAQKAKYKHIDTFQAVNADVVLSYRNPKSFSPDLTEKEFKLIAFYLPQFHPIPENDQWWGKGFTEWTNVTRAWPLFAEHRQPKLPQHLGFYDLRVPETRQEQANLAKQYGIHGFCYYYYWFNGRRLLEYPLEQVFKSGEPDFPFCICWANENWTRRWDGLDQEILMAQQYNQKFAKQFIHDVIPLLKDSRYIRYQNKPILLVYRIKEIPNIKAVTQLWREECQKLGVGDIHLAAVRFHDIWEDIREYGFDSLVNFPPHQLPIHPIPKEQIRGLHPDFQGLIYDYWLAVKGDLKKYADGYQEAVHRGLMLGWDNTARRGLKSHIAYGATPDKYKYWLSGIMNQELQHKPETESLIFINAWNEWAEGTTLEPDHHFGYGYLKATQQALREIKTKMNRYQPINF